MIPSEGATARARRGASIAVALAVAAAVFAATWVRIAALPLVDNLIFGGDGEETFTALVGGGYRLIGVDKHALYVVVMALLVEPQKAIGIPATVAVVDALAAVFALFAVALLFLCRRLGLGLTAAVGAVVLVLGANAVAIQSASVETYGLTLLAATVALHGFLSLEPMVARRPLAAGSMAGGLAGMVGLANTPGAAWALVFGFLAHAALAGETRLRRLVLAFAPVSLTAGAIAVLPTVMRDLVHGHAPFAWSARYAEKWASLANFADARVMADHLVGAFLFNWVSIGREPLPRYTVADVGLVAARPVAMVAAVGVAVLLAVAVVRLLLRRDDPLAAGLAATVAVTVAFYGYFNPAEVMLYASQWTLALGLLVAIGLRGIRLLPAAMVAVGLVLMVANEPAAWPIAARPQGAQSVFSVGVR